MKKRERHGRRYPRGSTVHLLVEQLEERCVPATATKMVPIHSVFKGGNLVPGPPLDPGNGTVQATYFARDSVFCGDASLTGNPTVFPLRPGGNPAVVTHNLCGDGFAQSTQFNIAGVFDPVNFETVFREVGEPLTGRKAFLWSQATAPAPLFPGAQEVWSRAQQTFFWRKNETQVSGIQVIDGKAKRDDAWVYSDPWMTARVYDTSLWLHNKNLVMEVGTDLRASEGGAATLIEDDGLRLYAQSGQTAEFHMIAIDYVGYSQYETWYVMFDGISLITSGIDPSLFEPIKGGYYLPWDSMPGSDLTAYIDTGDIEQSYETAAEVYTTPAPASGAAAARSGRSATLASHLSAPAGAGAGGGAVARSTAGGLTGSGALLVDVLGELGQAQPLPNAQDEQGSPPPWTEAPSPFAEESQAVDSLFVDNESQPLLVDTLDRSEVDSLLWNLLSIDTNPEGLA